MLPVSRVPMANSDNEVENEQVAPPMPESDPDEGIDINEMPDGPIYNGMCKMLFPHDPNFDEKWAHIWSVMELVLQDKTVRNKEWNAVFSDIYQLCNARETQIAKEFYDRVRGAIEKYIDEARDNLVNLDDESFFNDIHVQCERIQRIGKYLNTLFRALNQYIENSIRENQLYQILQDLHRRPLLHIDQLVSNLWKEKVLDTCVSRVAAIVLKQFDNHRAGRPVENIQKLKEVIQYFIAADDPFEESNPIGLQAINARRDKLNLYHNGIEEPLKKSCFEYNNQKLKEWSDITNSITYINKVAELMDSEKTFAYSFMHPTTSDAIETWVAEVLVNDKIIDSKLSFKDQMTRDNFNEAHLKRCFNVLKLIPNGVDSLCHDFGEHVTEIVTSDVKDNMNDPKLFVTTCSTLYERFNGIVKRVFYNHKDFTAAVDKAIRSTVNTTIPGQFKPGDKVARFADQYLKKQQSSDEDHQLDNFATVLKFIIDKEQFEKTYQVLLANRLLGRITASIQREIQAIEKMRGSCSAEIVQRCVRMCLDMERSSNENTEFRKQHPVAEGVKQPPIEVTILQTGSWPLQIGKEEHGPATPAYLVDSLQSFTDYYTKLHSGRNLTWAPSLSTVDVRLTYLERPITVTMTAIHYDIISCFEDVNEYSISDLGVKAKLIPEFLKRYCKPFVEYGILTMSKPDDWSPQTVISLNPNFTRKNTKMRLPIPMTNRALKLDIRPEVTGDQSDANRQVLDSIIVRELKRLKKAKHAILWADVSKLVENRFVPTTQLFKKCIESLIDRGYVKRGDEIDEYHYIA